MMKSEELFERAVRKMPGGVNSPVRACRNVGGSPRFIEKADGAFITDVDGRRYVDYVCSWGPMLLGHNRPEVREAVVKAAENGLSFGAATRAEVEMAELICDLVPSIEMVRMVNSGTEAVMSAVRAARGFTGRNKVIKFAGCYHGHSDSMLVKAGSGVMTMGVPDSAGVPAGCAEDTLTAVYNDLDGVEQLFLAYPEKIAAVVIEPVAANMGVVLPDDGFLAGLRVLCDRFGAVLIFDEVITGFRLSISGAQGFYHVSPDLTTFGKIIGGGMPVGAYGGRRDIMECVAPAGPVYQAGTLSGNPIAMAAGMAMLRLLDGHPEVYEDLERKGEYLRNGLKKAALSGGKKAEVTGVGSLSCVFFTDMEVKNYEDAKTSDTEEFAKYYRYMLDAGNYFAPSQFEAIFLSGAHSYEMLDETLRAAEEYFRR